MKNYRSNVAFIDLLFNLLAGFVSLFIIAIMLINPVAKTGVVDPNLELMITLEWDKNSNHDYDLWVKGPGNQVVGFNNKESGYMTLERDDLGSSNDRFWNSDIQDWIEIKRNLEVVAIRGLVPGKYYVSVHFFGKRPKEEPNKVNVVVTDLSPFRVVIDRTVATQREKQEIPVIAFTVNEKGDINFIDYDSDVRIARNAQTYGGPY
jgi:hypothetical protein